MDEIVEFYSGALPHGGDTHTRIVTEIAYLEGRLREIESGDCAYEKAMARTYNALLVTRRGQLSNILNA